LRTGILLISASWVARITDVNHQCPVCTGYFWDKISLFAQASLDMTLLFYVSCCSWENRCALPCPAFPGEIRSHKLLCAGCPRIEILLISVSQAARITGMNHQHPAQG
jgi:hypothetical protein